MLGRARQSWKASLSGAAEGGSWQAPRSEQAPARAEVRICACRATPKAAGPGLQLGPPGQPSRPGEGENIVMDSYPGWGDIEHQQTDIELAVPVSDALRLRAELPALAKLLADGQARTPAEREYKREARAAVERLLGQLHERLRPYGVPQADQEAGDQD